MILPFIYIAPSDKGGRGVFTSEDIPVDTVIEVSPVLVLSAEERKAAETTALFNYIFEWGDAGDGAAVAWGYVSMYNHYAPANCHYTMDADFETITITTVRDIKAGEELFINYLGEPDHAGETWFESR